MDSRFLRAQVAELSTHRVLARRLHPFCVNDITLLAHIGSPFFHGQRNRSPLDLRLAVLICSTPFHRLNLDPDSWRNRWWLVRTSIFGRSCFEAELALFYAYLDEFFFSTKPELWVRKGSTKMLDLPWALGRAQRCISNGLSEERVRTMPISLMLWHALAVDENEGAEVKIVTDSDRAFFAQIP